MRSADGRSPRLRRRPLIATTMALMAIPLAGCTSTQHEAQREQLDSARLRAALDGTRVRTQSSSVRPTAIRWLRSGRRAAMIVTVRNLGRREVTDLPISVGYLNHAGTRVYLNDGTDLRYYAAHLPAIPAGGVLTWVFTTSAAVPAHARLFAAVGSRESVPALLTETDVHLQVRVDRPTGGGSSITVHLKNPTSVPQYQLQLYATVLSAGRYVAAGNATVADLGAGSSQAVTVPLVGSATGGRLEIHALPTVLQ